MSKQETYCAWAENKYHGAWDTVCGNKFQFEADGPTENGFKYCPYCGNRLAVVDLRKMKAEV